MPNIIGTTGNDTLVGTSGDDTIDGLAGNDTASYATATSAVTVNLSVAGSQNTAGAGTDTLISIENLIGSSSGDTLAGDGGANILSGGDGDDTLTGGAGDDVLDGGLGNDMFDGGAGFDTQSYANASGPISIDIIQFVNGAAGSERVGASIERIIGSSFADLIHAPVATIIDGGPGDDTLFAGDQNTLFGGTGDDLLHDEFSPGAVPGTNNIFDGGPGTDTLALIYAPGSLTVDLRISGVAQNTGSYGMDIISNIENFIGSNFDDTIIGDVGANVLSGNSGNDTIDGGAGNDTLNGNDGNDTLTGGTGADTLVGGLGNDTYIVDATDTLVENAGEGTDTVLADISFTLAANIENLTLAGTAAINATGNAADNVLTGNGSANTLTGGAGNDTLIGGLGADVLIGGTGNDTYYVDASDTVTENTGEGIDTIVSVLTYTLPNEVENLTLGGGAAINGFGNVGDNALIGNAAANNLSGSLGSDTLTGGLGVDSLFGGADADTFQDSAAGLNGDTIGDFSNIDRIVIIDANVNSFSASIAGNVLSYTGGSVTLTAIPAGHLAIRSLGATGVELTISTAPIPHPAQNDFNGDGRSDLLLRSDSGAVQTRLGQGNGALLLDPTVVSSGAPASWHILGSGDFNGDGRVDVLWRDDNGQFGDWLGQGNGSLSYNSAAGVVAVPTAWQIAGVGDFNGDGRSDILWRNVDGSFGTWLANTQGGFAYNAAAGIASAPTDWKIAGVGDFNGDGRDDILWRNDNGQFGDWLANANGSFTYNAAGGVTAVPTSWHIEGVGDFNGDGRDDILWRSDGGLFGNWLANAGGGFAYNIAAGLTPVGNDWKIAAIGDYNGDTRDDILWRNDNGALGNWLGQSDGSLAYNAAAGLVQIPTDWHVQPPQLII